jgi:hypothetical protein
MIKINVGEKEKHKVRFDYNPLWGKVSIEVDGKVIVDTSRMLMGYHPFEFEVGNMEKHQVKIDLDNVPGFAFFGSKVFIHIDGVTVRQEKIMNNRFSTIMLVLMITAMMMLVISLL